MKNQAYKGRPDSTLIPDSPPPEDKSLYTNLHVYIPQPVERDLAIEIPDWLPIMGGSSILKGFTASIWNSY